MVSVVRDLVLAGCAGVVLSGCAIHGKAVLPVPMVPGPGSVMVQEFKRSEYTVLASVTGTSTVTYGSLWPIPIAWMKRDGRLEYFGFDTPLIPRQYVLFTNDFFVREPAVSNALAGHPEADALISPVFQVERKRTFFWHARTTVTVKGKAIRFNSDPASTAP